MRVGGYVRVSTQEQAREGYSIGAQVDRLTAYCHARDWTLCGIYADPAYSGAKLDRPALQRLLRDVRSGTLDLVLVYKLDRLSRSQKDTLFLIEDVFMKYHVSFVSLGENFDTSTAFGRAMVGILSVFAQLEREQIRERTSMGRLERARDGLWKGGGVPPIGYDYDEAEGRLKINENEALQVCEVFNLYTKSNASIAQIRREMERRGYTYKCGAWHHDSTVRGVLANPVYAGLIEWNGETYPGRHPPLIERELFLRAQERLRRGSSAYRASQLLTGLLYCGQCGARCFGLGEYRGSKKLPCSQREYLHYYVCYSRAKTKQSMVRDSSCRNKRWKTQELDEIVLRAVHSLNVIYWEYFDLDVLSVQDLRRLLGTLIRRIEIDGEAVTIYWTFS